MEIYRVFVLFLSIVGTLTRQVHCWQYFTKFRDLVMTGTDMEQLALHSEYYFGDCRRSGIRLYTSVHIQNIEVTGKIIIRGWIDVKRIPTCIVLRGYAPNEHLFRSTSYNFQMCAPRISYCHSKRQFRYYYYEWYIPSNYKGGMDWDILFYGPPSLVWQ